VPSQAPHRGGICSKRFYVIPLTLDCVAHGSNNLNALLTHRKARDSSVCNMTAPSEESQTYSKSTIRDFLLWLIVTVAIAVLLIVCETYFAYRL